MAKYLLHAITVLTLVVGVCYAVPSPEPAPQIERLITNLPLLGPLINLVAWLVAFLTGVIGELLNLSLIGGLLESLLALGNEDPDGRR